MVIEAIMELVKKCRHYGKPAAIYTPNAAAQDHMPTATNTRCPCSRSPPGRAVGALPISYQQHLYRLLQG
ncbi:MAG: hypothetical protein M0C28_31680 [Candidatus Moduliflexus flocculans]|nr:hypothetical protein [Candidatus Moduliflexus flocculans]